jgi:hypothetical protein
VLPSARDVQQPSKKNQATTASRVDPRRSAMRAASLASRARRVRNGSRTRCCPATNTPHAPTPNSTTMINGRRKLEELVAVAEIESG